MTEIIPEKPAPTSGEIMNALRIRDELAARIAKVKNSTDYSRATSVGKMHAKIIAEALIEQGVIDTARIHRDIIVGPPDDEDEDDFPDEG